MSYAYAWCHVLAYAALTLETGRTCYLNGCVDGEDGFKKDDLDESQCVVEFLYETHMDQSEMIRRQNAFEAFLSSLGMGAAAPADLN